MAKKSAIGSVDPQLLADMVAMRSTLESARLITLDTVTITNGGRTDRSKYVEKTGEIVVCSACFGVIDKTWDHSDWCELYKAEPLSAWIKKGKNEK